ncbi:DNA-dependent metalloprotease WSS1-like [Quillaja saponaria]|uniref:DNA-dependent metalloprotease WSS1-like n=1 Tax=Quillaja saponaria TaxID=32244 RepID=A0AAD7LRB2_QUISA|nr:DNA-dependent metalloprotease WSS1-like [Quillaja saponaria]
MDLNDLNKVWEIRPLKKIGENDARNILEKIAKQVQPIMRRRKWKVQVLSEFCPANPSLQGLNIGQGAEVKLRLRRPKNEWDFFPYEQILDTMLHELCHNEYGPHNTDFYNLLDAIRKECGELMAKGISGTGQGFDLPGRRLGGFSRQPPLSSIRQSALAAAESRARHGALFESGPKRLGGDRNIKAALSPIQAAARAADRRLHDDLWCGSKSMESETYLQEKTGSSTGPSEMPKTSLFSQGLSVQTPPVESAPAKEILKDGENWQCKTCTLLNQSLEPICEACGTQKQEDTAKFKIWTCKFCTLHNSVELDKCLACGEWRYSYGPPISARTPYVGS